MAKKRSLLGPAALVTAGALGVGNYFYNTALTPKGADKIIKDKSLSQLSAKNRRWLRETGFREMFARSHDGLRLHAIAIEQQKTDRWVVCCHGYAGNATGFLDFARGFYDMGFSVLVPDARGHGDSGGSYIGMGWHDRLDVLRWCEMLSDQYDPQDIVLFGVSMGASTVMMAAGEALPTPVRAVVEDCGFTSAWDQLAFQLKKRYHLPPRPVMDLTNVVTKARAGYSLREADAAAQLQKSSLPVMFIHGDADTFVPYKMMETLYHAAAGEKEKYIVRGARHTECAAVAGDFYWQRIAAFLQKHLN